MEENILDVALKNNYDFEVIKFIVEKGAKINDSKVIFKFFNFNLFLIFFLLLESSNL
jgi:hypothetical protein